MEKTKPFDIPKKLFVEAFKDVKKNAGAAGVDHEAIEDFENDLKNNLYKLWNRMSSGSYMPPPIRAVPIPKKSGGKRLLGIPTVSDRVAQAVAKCVFEPGVEAIFLPDSYAYRKGKSATDAVGVTRQRCWKSKWVVEFDIKGLFDNLSHELLMKLVRKHTQEKWLILYIERWLKAPMQNADGTMIERTCGTPQGGVISPVLSNLFLHYVFDDWMRRNHPGNQWCRYADDGLVHCKTQEEAERMLTALKERFLKCGLELHPEKTQIVYCGKGKEYYPNRSFDFLGYTFRARRCKNAQRNTLFTGFSPGVSKKEINRMRAKIKKSNVRNRTELSLEKIAKWSNPILIGWINYYGKYTPSAMYPVWRYFNKSLVAWAMRKYKSLRRCKTNAVIFLQRIAKENPDLFAHWRVGMVGGFT